MMSVSTFVLLCVQVFLIQNVYSQCLGGIGPLGNGPACGVPTLAGWGAPGPAAPWGAPGPAAPWGAPGPATPWGAAGCGAAYGGAGVGNVAVSGELPVGGATAVTGQVPIIGGVEFAGMVPAVGFVTITGSCACGCVGPYAY